MPSLETLEEEKNKIFLQELFQHEKCIHWKTRDDYPEVKLRVTKAVELAQRAHANQKRKDGKPYMNHIRRTVLQYLDSVTKKEQVSVDDIIVTILHDVIEDHPKYLDRIHERKGGEIARRILGISKPSPAVLENTYGHITTAILTNPLGMAIQGYHYLFQKFLPRNTEQLQTHVSLYIHLTKMLPIGATIDDFKNYQFFWMIANLSEDDFEIKCADRLDNLGDLERVDLDYIEKNLISTEVYRLKAEALGRHDLAEKLHDGRNGLLARKRDITGIGL